MRFEGSEKEEASTKCKVSFANAVKKDLDTEHKLIAVHAHVVEVGAHPAGQHCCMALL